MIKRLAKKFVSLRIFLLGLYGYRWLQLHSQLWLKTLLGVFSYGKNPAKFHYPKVLQLPITYKCNCDCIMCGMQKLKMKENITYEQLGHILKSKLFKNIKAVGLNGGEPFFLKDLSQYVKILADSLPKLKNLYIITNGTLTNQILRELPQIKEICKAAGIILNVSVSVDGIGKVQDKMRGLDGCFEKVEKTCRFIVDQDLCDHFGIAATITKENIKDIVELEQWANENKYPIAFNVATVHERLENKERLEMFDLWSDEKSRHLAMEFFYSKFLERKEKRYFAFYYYLFHNERIALCDYRQDGVTILPNGGIAYCATFSKELGNALENDAYQIFRSNLSYRKKLTAEKCSKCSQYTVSANYKGNCLYIKDYLKYIGNPAFMLKK